MPKRGRLTLEIIEEITYPYLAGIAGALSLNEGWSERKQDFLVKTHQEMSLAIWKAYYRARKGTDE